MAQGAPVAGSGSWKASEKAKTPHALGTAPGRVTVYNRATIKVLIYLYYENIQLLLSGGSTQPVQVKLPNIAVSQTVNPEPETLKADS